MRETGEGEMRIEEDAGQQATGCRGREGESLVAKEAKPYKTNIWGDGGTHMETIKVTAGQKKPGETHPNQTETT